MKSFTQRLAIPNREVCCRLLFATLMVLACSLPGTLSAQSVSGKVLDAESTPLGGANVVIQGTRTGVITGFDGSFVLTVPAGRDTLVITYIGYQEKKVAHQGQQNLIITMQEADNRLEDVVITALGIERETKALGYAVQEVQGEGLTQARETNLVSALAGRVAGVNVTGGSNSIGGSARVVIRGETSLDGDNQPLFVVDGIPISNDVGVVNQSGQNIDYGNAASEINPDDIATITVLKGPNAAALYGSRASNGVILITTKSGRSTRGVGVSFNSTTSFENPLRLPTYQNEYGQGRGGVYNIGDGGRSWGPALDGRQIAVPVNTEWTPKNGEIVSWEPYPDNVKEFYETGRTLSNNFSVTAGSDKGNLRLSYTNLDQTGMVPNTDQERNTISLNVGYDLSKRLSIKATANHIITESDNRPTVSYGNESVVYTWIWEGRQVRTDKMRDYWVRGQEGTQPFTYNYRFNDNPYYTVYENLNGLQKDRTLGNIVLNYKIATGLNLMLRSGMDMYNQRTDNRRTPGSNAYALGMYRQDRTYFKERNSDFLLTYDKKVNQDWALNLAVGGNQMSQEEQYLSARANELSIPGIYNLGNSRIPLVNVQYDSKYQINSLYGFGQIAYKNALFLDFSARNDWSSSLPVENNSYFYPSVSLSAVISDLLEIPNSSALSFAKARISYAQVGNDTRPYRLRNVYGYASPWDGFQAVAEPSSIPNADLVPESVNTFELGFDVRFFKNRVRLDVTYYNTISRNQIINIPIDLTSGYTSRFLNAGEVRSQGLEAMLNLTPVKLQNGLQWDINVNWSTNRAEVVELAEGLDTYELPSRYVSVQARLGERMGDMYGRGFLRDPSGNVIHRNGLPVLTDELIKVGNYNPDWMAGIYNTISFKGIQIGALVDWRKGGSIYSYMYVRGNQAGQLAESLPGREGGYVGEGVVDNGDGTFSPNTEVVTAERYWGSNYFNPESATFDASYVKLREVIVGYTIPNHVWGKLGLRDVRIQFVGRNVALWTAVPHIDPDTSGLSGGTILPGIEDMTLPTPRSLGVNVGFRF